jgi:hypothetical protein
MSSPRTGDSQGLQTFLCQAAWERRLLGQLGSRPSNTMAKWFGAAVQPTMGIAHSFDAS